MSALRFTPVSDGLYEAAGDGSPVTSVYWVLLDGAPPAGDLDPAATWSSWSGCYAFVPSGKPIADPAGFVGAITTLIGVQANVRALAWVTDPATVATTAITVKGVIGATPGQAQTAGDLNVPFGNVTFTATKGSTLAYDPSPVAAPGTPAITIASTSSGGVVGLARAGGSTNLAAPATGAAVPLGGAAAGAYAFGASWDRGDLYTFFADDPTSWDTPPGNEVRYFYKTQGAEQALRYPVFLGQAPSQAPADLLALAVTLDPFAPFDAGRTWLGLDVAAFGGAGGPVLPTCTSLAATDGATVELIPRDGAGFALGRRPRGASTEDADAYAYLTPTGTFDVKPVAGGSPIRHLMGGLTGTEYLLLAPGATVTFVPQHAAYAPVFTTPTPPGVADPCHPAGGDEPVVPGSLLDAGYTTAWLRVDPPAAPSATVDRGYAMQPASSVYYGSADASGYAYPLAQGCRVSRLVDPAAPQQPVAVPLAPYGQVWATGATTLPTAPVLKAFESQIIAATRLTTAPKDPVDGPVVFEILSHEPVAGGAVMTADGLLASLNDAPSGRPGTFAGIQLAKSPNTVPLPGAAELAFTGTPVMAPDLSYALINDNLFMVATDADALGGAGKGFANVIQMGEWTFRLDVAYSADQAITPTTMMVFKFTTAYSVVDLVANTAYWQDWATFIGPDTAKVKDVQRQLNALLCQAKPDGTGTNDLFTDFWAKVSDPAWTGILAMDCGLDAADLPVDLQDLLGGISGQLRAHHFGVTVNRVKGADSSSWEMDTSSMFALIHYDKAYAAPAPGAFAFQVLRLNVLFENSVQTHFDSRIAVTIPTLFSTEVELPASSDPNVPAGFNVIEIDGVYQSHGDSGTVVFDTKQAQAFSFDTATAGFRVLDEVYVTDATLVPVNKTTDGEKITVTSSLDMAGTLLFSADVSAAAQKGKGVAPAMDLFAYGDAAATPPTGLGFVSYGIAMTTDIVDGVGQITKIGPDLGQLRVTPATSAVRPGSLPGALPVRLTALEVQPSVVGWPVTFDGASKDTFAPTYALRFEASLGSLGALSSGTLGLDVVLELGWQAATGTGSDKVWLLMVPPASMYGKLGFGLEGVMDVTFTGVSLVRQKWPASGTPSWTVYAISFLNVNVELLGLLLVPGVSDLTLFAPPAQGSSANIGWLMSFSVPIVPPA